MNPFERVNPQTSDLVKETHDCMREDNLDVDRMMEEYAKRFPKTAAIRLLQDLEESEISVREYGTKRSNIFLGKTWLKWITQQTTRKKM